MKKIRLIICFVLPLFILGCNNTPGSKQYQTANEAYARGDYVTSYKNYLFAANKGITPAQYAVGYQSYYGLGVRKDTSTAILWFKEAADSSMEATYALDLIRQNQEPPPWLMYMKHEQ